jgi:formate-dependent nitrite reductase membrane component NrfD
MSLRASDYNDLPMLKEPVWIWSVPVYFSVGGIAGAAATIAAVAQLFGGRRMARLVRAGRALATTGTALGGLLLVHDLGRPERFLNMLRVFRPTSAMSMGSWMIAAEGGLGSISAIAARRVPGVADAAGLGAGLVGIPFSGYTAVLLADTSVPVWRATSKSLPWLFVASSLGTAASLLDAVELEEVERRVVDRLGWVAFFGELAALKAVERDLSRDDVVAKPLQSGLPGTLWNLSTGATLAGAGASLLPARSRVRRILAPLVGVTGSLALRFAVVLAGRQSARDPEAARRVSSTS